MIFCLLLGAVGGHKFYRGSWGWGLVYLFASPTFIPAIAAFVEFLIMAFDDNEGYQQKHGGKPAPFRW